MTTKTIILDITEAKLPPLVTVKQGDSGRTLEVVVQDGGKDFSAPAGTTATLRIMDTQGRSASVPGTVVAFGGKTTVTVGLTSEALAYAGKYAADIKLSSPDGSESTLNFWLQVQIAPTSDTPIPTPGGGITREELDQALRQNSAVDQAHTDEAVSDLAEKTGVKIRPRVCFVDDDGGAPVPTVLFPWLQEHDVPYCFAIATGDIETGGDSFASWADLRAMQADSRVSWSCHAINDDVMADYTPEQMEAKYQQWRRDMTAHGLRSDAITVMYNHGSSVQETIDKVVGKYFRFGFSTTKGINTAPFDSYHMLRVGLFPRDGSYTLAQAKALVDQLVEVGTGVVVFFTHCYFESFDLDGLTELVEYIRAKGVEITGLEDALRLYDPKTACDCGDWVEVPGEPEYSRTIAQATSTNAGQKVVNSSAQNCVLTVQVSGKRVRAAGTAYSNNGMISWLDSEGNVIGCIWQDANKSGDAARFALELPVPYGAVAIMVSGNSGRRLPRVEVLSSGSGGVSHEELDRVLEGVKAYVDAQDGAFFQSLDTANRRIIALEAKPAGVSQADFETYKSQQSESIAEISDDVNLLKNVTSQLNSLNSFYPLSLGRMNNNGVPTSSQKYGYTSDFFYAKKGSFLKINQDEDVMRMRVALFNEPNRDTFVRIITSLTEYEFTADSWYRVDIEYRDSTVIATEAIFDNIVGYIIKGDETQFVASFESFKSACENASVKKVVLTKGIVATEQTNVIGDKHINGMGHKITGNADITYLLKVHDSKTVTIENIVLEGAKDDVIYVGYGTTYIIDCDISKSYENDGVGLHATAICYIRDCKIHDNYDEGLSTHDQSWCECVNVEAYHNGYIVGTDTPSTTETGGQVSFGGLHFGGSKMGNAKNCYCHNNSANGIGFITIDGNFATDCIAVCEGNICTDNAESGIRFGGTYGIRAIGNLCANNGQGMLFYKKDNHGNTGIVGQNSLFNNTGSQRGVWSGGDDGLVFETT